MAAANGFGKVMVGQGGILSTPAASQCHPQIQGLRRHRPVGQPQSRRPARGFRHQVQYRQWRPGAGKDHRRDLRKHQDDRELQDRRHRRRSIIDKIGTVEAGGMTVEVIDPVADYAELMETLFDFDAIRANVRSGFRMRFDAMSASPAPMPRRSSRTGSARQTAPCATACRCRISAAIIPIRTWSTPRSSMTR